MLVTLVLLHCYNKLNGYHDIYNNLDISGDGYCSTELQHCYPYTTPLMYCLLSLSTLSEINMRIDCKIK